MPQLLRSWIKEDERMKKIIHLTLFLAIISALAGGVLGLVNQITDPIIQEKKIAAVKSSLQAIFPGTSDLMLVFKVIKTLSNS